MVTAKIKLNIQLGDTFKIAVVVAQDRNGQVIAQKA